MSEKSKSQGDFRYAVGDAKVPWHAVGEFYHAADVMEVVKFLLPDAGSTKYADQAEAVHAALENLQSCAGVATKLTLGKKVAAAEAACREYLKVKYALFTSNWTSGMEIGYKLSGLRPGDEVIMPAITFIATMAYPLMIGAKIVFCDIDPETMNLDPNDLENKITDKTRLIVPVHIGGYPCDMDPIMAIAKKHDLYVMEDAAHGFGGWYKGQALGTIGHFGGYSFHEVKNVNSFGEGGILVTNLPAGEQLSLGRFLGLDFSRKIKDWLYDISPLHDRYGRPQIANNCSVTEIQALGLLLQLGRIDRILAQRREAAAYMNQVLATEPGILTEKPDNADFVGTHHLYTLRIDPAVVGADIQVVKQRLADKGLTCITHFGPMYRFDILKELGYDANAIAATCPQTEEMFYHRYTHLPLYPLTREELEYQAKTVVEVIRELKAEKQR